MVELPSLVTDDWLTSAIGGCLVLVLGVVVERWVRIRSVRLRLGAAAAVHTSLLEELHRLRGGLSTLTGLGSVALMLGVLSAIFELLVPFRNFAGPPLEPYSVRVVRDAADAFGPVGLGLGVAVIAVACRAMLAFRVEQIADRLEQAAVAALNSSGEGPGPASQ